MNVNISIGYSASDILYEDVELEFKTGEVNNIIGENGTGKSTFYKTLIGELKPLSGTVPLEIKKEYCNCFGLYFITTRVKNFRH